MKRAWKGLFRKGEANVVKIVCLSVGLAIGLVMLAEVIFERSYDNFLPGLKETYRVEERYKQKGTDWRSEEHRRGFRSEEHTSELQSHVRISWCHRTGVAALLSGGGSGHPFYGNWVDDADDGRP